MNKEIIEQAAIEYVEKGSKNKGSAYWAFTDGANFVLNNLWQQDTDDESLLPEIDKEVVVLTNSWQGHKMFSGEYRDRSGDTP